MRYFLFIAFFVFLCQICFAQELEVVEPLHSTIFEIVEAQDKKYDANGIPCAVVKVQLPVAGVAFEGNVIESRFHINEYWVWFTSGTNGTKKFRIKCPGAQMLEVDVTKTISDGLQPDGKYAIKLNLPVVLSEKQYNSDLEEYENIVSKAKDCFNKKLFKEARKYYEEAIVPQYASYYNVDSFKWISLCDTIIKAQTNFQAVTTQLAHAIHGFDSFSQPSGFSEGIMVVDQEYGNISLISKEGNRIQLNETKVQLPYLFRDGILSVNMNGNNCFIDKSGVQKLNYRSSNYNNYFKDSYLDFSQFINDYSYIFNYKDGKIGLINRRGDTVLPLTKKYKHLTVLKDKVILYDQKHIYCWIKPLTSRLELNKKDIFKFLDYEGLILPNDITEDYIIITNNEIANSKNKDEVYIFSFETKKIYTVISDFAYPINSTCVLLRKDNITLDNGEKKSHNYTILDYKTGKKIVDNMEYAKVVSEDLVFDGKKCYDTSGIIHFSLDSFATCSDAGAYQSLLCPFKSMLNQFRNI